MSEAKALGLAKKGYSVQAITKTLGMPRPRVVKLFQKHGLPVRTRQLYGPEVQAQILALHSQGLTLAQIAKKLDMWAITVKKLLVNAGVKPNSIPNPTYTALDVQAMLALHLKGLNPNQIAKKMKVSPATVSAHLRRAGISLPSRPEYTEDDKQRMISLFMSGSSPNAIANTLKIAPATVRRHLREAGEAVPQVPLHTKQEIDAILRLRKKGMSVYSISDALNIPSSSVFYWLVRQPDYEPKHYWKNGKPYHKSRLTSIASEQSSRSLSDDQIMLIVRLHRQGQTVVQISEQMKVSQQLVRHVIG